MSTHISPRLYRQLKVRPLSAIDAWLTSVFGVFAYRHGYFNPLNITVIGRMGEQKNAPAISLCLPMDAEHTLDDYEQVTSGALLASTQRALFVLTDANTAPIAAIALIQLDDLSDCNLARLKHHFVQQQGKLWLAYSCNLTECTLYWLTDNRDPAFAGPLAERFEVWLDAVAQQPLVPILRQPLLTASDSELIDRSLRGPKIERDFSAVVHQFEQQVEANPTALAVCCMGDTWEYKTLNHRANQLAHHLMALGVERGDKVAVYLSASPRILQCLLAIHKIGAVYVPIDPALPQARVSAMCDVVKPRLMLGLQQFQPAQMLLSIVFVAIDDSIIDSRPQHSVPRLALTADCVSHVFFTSGTTGTPKAVVATHGNLLHYVAAAQERYCFGPQDRFISSARFTFSISLFELLIPLASGASIELLSREQVLDLGALCTALRRATVLHFGPSLLKQLLPYIAKHYPLGSFNNIRHASSGGDMVPVEVLRSLCAAFDKAEVFVIYGSSEISCMGCTYRVPAEAIVSRVGQPFNNVDVRILDIYGNTVPPGVAGLLQFIGLGVVAGYMDLPDLTAERFGFVDTVEGYEQKGLGRSYHIGDVGRLDNDGNIELLGREDFQVQVRGMRVELVEVEQCLKRHPVIADCLVAARKLMPHSDANLVAYVVFNLGQAADARQLSNYLAEHLPDYMVPSMFVMLERLPTNHNNKIDRSQLPLPCADNRLLSNAFSAPDDEVEQVLLQLLVKITGMDGADNIGTQHSFFELGGDSLQAVQWLTAINQHYQKFIPIAYLLQHATVKALARVVRGEVAMPGVGEVVVLEQGDIEQAPLFCLYGVLLYRDLARTLNTTRSVCGVYLAEEIALMQDNASFDEIKGLMTVNSIAERYLQCITQYQPQGPYYLCGESFGGIIALEVTRKLKQRGQSVALTAMFDTTAPRFLATLTRWQKIKLHVRQAQINKAYALQKIRAKWALRPKSVKMNPSADQLRANARSLASENYHPAPFDDSVLLLIARDRSPFEPFIHDLGWRPYLPNLTSVIVKGDHLSMLQEGNVHDLAAHLESHL